MYLFLHLCIILADLAFHTQEAHIFHILWICDHYQKSSRVESNWTPDVEDGTVTSDYWLLYNV